MNRGIIVFTLIITIVITIAVEYHLTLIIALIDSLPKAALSQTYRRRFD